MLKKNRLIMFLSFAAIIIALAGSSVLIFPSQSGSVVRSVQGVQPERNGAGGLGGNVIINSVDSDDYKINSYNFELNDISDGSEEIVTNITKGTQVVTKDVSGNPEYIYTFGYYWDSITDVPTENPIADITGNTTHWKEQPSNVGWGVAAIDKTKEYYSDMYAVLQNSEGEDYAKVTYITDCFANCTKLKKAPALPSFVVNSDRAFMRCSVLETVDLPQAQNSSIMNNIGKNMFMDCTALKKLYIPYTVEKMSAASAADSAFYGCSSELTLYVQNDDAGSWAGYWNYRNPSEKVNVKYGYSLMDYAVMED